MYDRALVDVGQRRWALIKDFATSYETMTDDVAEVLLKSSFDIRAERFALQQEFVKKLVDTMGARIAGRFVQVDNQLTNLVDLQIAQQLPLVQKPE